MNFSELLREYCLQEVDDQTSSPDGVSVSEQGLSTSPDDEVIEVNPYWMEFDEDPFGLSSISDREPEGREMPNDYYLHLEEGVLYQESRNMFDELRSRISLEYGEVETVSFKQLSHDDTRFYTADDADFGALALVSAEREITGDVEPLLNHVCEQMQELDEDLTTDQIVSVECSYSDFSVCELISVRGHIVTPNPHRYYSNVDSVIEYIEAVADDEEDHQKLQSQGQYKVFYRVDELDEEPPEETCELCEEYMQARIEELATVTGDHMFEGEAIIVKNYDGYESFREDDSVLGYEISDGAESISFWIRFPVDDWRVE